MGRRPYSCPAMKKRRQKTVETVPKVDYTPESGNLVDFKPARPVINRWLLEFIFIISYCFLEFIFIIYNFFIIDFYNS